MASFCGILPLWGEESGYLDEQEKQEQQTQEDNLKQGAKSREIMFGCLRGEYKIANDFDAPLEDFKEYME